MALVIFCATILPLHTLSTLDGRREERKEFAIKYPINIIAMCVAPLLHNVVLLLPGKRRAQLGHDLRGEGN